MMTTIKLSSDAAKRMFEATQTHQLQVKELAAALDVSVRYVYEMRRCGFQMHGENNYCQTATVAAAKKWILENGFRIISGVGIKSFEPYVESSHAGPATPRLD